MRRVWLAPLLAAGMVIGGAATVTARQSHQSAFRGTVHVVRAGESLWEIARRAYPGVDARASIERLQRANHLRGGGIAAGQRLLIPSR